MARFPTYGYFQVTAIIVTAIMIGVGAVGNKSDGCVVSMRDYVGDVAIFSMAQIVALNLHNLCIAFRKLLYPSLFLTCCSGCFLSFAGFIELARGNCRGTEHFAATIALMVLNLLVLAVYDLLYEFRCEDLGIKTVK